MKKIEQLTSRIKLLLETMPQLRDDDTRLHQAIRREDVAEHGYVFDTLTGKDISDLECMGVISKLDAVTRVRRLIEHKHPNLRGVTYPARQIKAGVVRVEIKKI